MHNSASCVEKTTFEQCLSFLFRNYSLSKTLLESITFSVLLVSKHVSLSKTPPESIILRTGSLGHTRWQRGSIYICDHRLAATVRGPKDCFGVLQTLQSLFEYFGDSSDVEGRTVSGSQMLSLLLEVPPRPLCFARLGFPSQT